MSSMLFLSISRVLGVSLLFPDSSFYCGRGCVFGDDLITDFLVGFFLSRLAAEREVRLDEKVYDIMRSWENNEIFVFKRRSTKNLLRHKPVSIKCN